MEYLVHWYSYDKVEDIWVSARSCLCSIGFTIVSKCSQAYLRLYIRWHCILSAVYYLLSDQPLSQSYTEFMKKFYRICYCLL